LTLKDVNGGSIYDAPLLVIVGSPTYGKATMKVVFPPDTNITAEANYSAKPADNYLKLTTGKLYRITGSSAQRVGVQPDIRLPDLSEADPRKENNSPHALTAAPIEPNRYYKPYPALSCWGLPGPAQIVPLILLHCNPI
jgi:carboxyl-terminal processing protease